MAKYRGELWTVTVIRHGDGGRNRCFWRGGGKSSMTVVGEETTETLRKALVMSSIMMTTDNHILGIVMTKGCSTFSGPLRQNRYRQRKQTKVVI